MRETKREETVTVPMAKQTEDIRSRWGWVEPTVWTDRMLNALETGVKGDKWFSLIDKVYDKRNLAKAFQSVAANRGAPGIDCVTIKDFERHLEHNLDKLSERLARETYEPLPVKRVLIDKPDGKGKRPLGVPAVRDRVVQKALCNVIQPIFEIGFSPDSYGFRPGMGCKDALRQVQAELRSGKRYVLDADIKSFFDSIDHELLMSLVERNISDGRTLSLIRQFLEQNVFDGQERWTPEEGTPQGGVLSPLLANIFLDELDWLVPAEGVRMIRYADDFVVLCDSPEKAKAALDKIRKWCGEWKLTLHPDKTKIVDLSEREAYFDFLGYRFKRTKGKGRLIKVPRPKSLKSLRNKIRPLTKRCNGHSMEAIIGKVNPILKGWYEYFKHSHDCANVDGWVRMRLRSILRKRRKRKGRAKGGDHHRYPNSFFHALGLFSLEHARVAEVQSLRCNH